MFDFSFVVDVVLLVDVVGAIYMQQALVPIGD